MRSLIVGLVLLSILIPHTHAFFFNLLGGLLNPFGIFGSPQPAPIQPSPPPPPPPPPQPAQPPKPVIPQAEIPQFARIVRSADGSGNNRRNSNFGKASAEMPRLTQAAYADGKGQMIDRGNPRELSNGIGAFARGQNVVLNQYGLNMLFVLFGQFIDHDLDLVLPSGTQKALIAVPKGDSAFDKNNEGNKNIEFSRSKFSLKNGKRFFANQLTSFIDGSQVYGSSQETMKSLREFKGGRLKLENNMLIKDNNGAFVAGDIRVNQNIGLTSIQTIFAREHNRQCELYLSKFPGLGDEAIFQMARNMVIGFIQKITFKQYLPLLLGRDAFDKFVGDYEGYDDSINPTINLEFSTAAYRIGHPLLANSITLFDYFNKKIKSVSMQEMFLSFQLIKKQEDIDFIMNGMMRSQCKQRNNQIVDGLRNTLVEFPGVIQDLFSLNVQRGRDHGIPDYNFVRKQLGFNPIRSFGELSKNRETVSRLSKSVGNVNNLDLWIGIISEEALPGGNLGQVGAAIVGETFRRTRGGDRLWYESAYPDEEIQIIQDTTFSEIILRNTKLSKIPSGFKVPGFATNQGTGATINSNPNLKSEKTTLFDASQTQTGDSSTRKESTIFGSNFNFNDGRTRFFDAAPANSDLNLASTRGTNNNIEFFDVAQDPNLSPTSKK